MHLAADKFLVPKGKKKVHRTKNLNSLLQIRVSAISTKRQVKLFSLTVNSTKVFCFSENTHKIVKNKFAVVHSLN